MNDSPRSLLESAKAVLDNALGILLTRVELMATEFEEEKTRLFNIAIFGACTFVLLTLGLVFIALTLTVLFWDEHRLLTLVLLSATFMVSGGIALFLTARNMRPYGHFFNASIKELKKDRAALQGEQHEPPA